ncbi:uncharacterized protein BO66DRAFT_63263 [Aspergillus aculeatinus CBS 121060]|uniref:Uncharacterized protein n=1 Tax=Aspergillus aculeatinus CBS 121060 TaxID=1448322 RepID=A0ACD1HBW2_9EURO|nr:hypothetical protein BO66DRAFT_63263 [Aspergillus aculeatinus CBS 121060]RAH71029.1 hypothetical protein BO66DRAFT_63263 [Aspergillus aculeatinus CBS 121060]
MESEADSTVQEEVDILMFDYLLCTTIDQLLCYGRAKAEGQKREDHNIEWYLRTIETTRAVLLDPSSLSDDINTKDRLLNFAVIFCHRYALLQNSAPVVTALFLLANFLALCEGEGPGESWPELKDAISAHLIMAAAQEELAAAGIQSTSDYDECIHRVHEAIEEQSPAKGRQGYLKYFQPPSGLSLEVHLRDISNELPAAQLARAVVEYLTNLMQSLDPPILLQLERGKLGGLTREETRRLKERVGL